MNTYTLGFDIGGTKCAVVLGNALQEYGGTDSVILDKVRFATEASRGWRAIMRDFFSSCDALLERNKISIKTVKAVGVSCGGPLSSAKGIVYSPPNLPDWDAVPVTRMITERYGIPVYLQNDANACALAEWKFGAGRGVNNMIFLTFGTGMGAGLILDGRLYAGTNDMAGEVGHIRLAPSGPVGYGKAGSFEGFCSGGGIEKLAKQCIEQHRTAGETSVLFGMPEVNAKTIAEAARLGDALASSIFSLCGNYLGRGLAVLVDILNPERIVIGSIFERAGDLLRESMQAALNAEALERSMACCEVVPAALGDSIGDYAALGVAMTG